MKKSGKTFKRICSLILSLGIILSMTPAAAAMAATSYTYSTTQSSFGVRLQPYPGYVPASSSLTLNANGKHSEHFLNSYYSISGSLSSDVKGTYPEGYYWTNIVGLITIYGSCVGGVSGSATVSGNKKDGIGGQGSGTVSITTSKTTVDFEFEPDGHIQFALDTTAIGFINLTLKVAAITELWHEGDTKASSKLKFEEYFDLKKTLDK